MKAIKIILFIIAVALAAMSCAKETDKPHYNNENGKDTSTLSHPERRF